MSRKKPIAVLPNNTEFLSLKFAYGQIISVGNDYVKIKVFSSKQIIPFYRFVKETDFTNFIVGKEVKISYYYNNSGNLLAYNAELI